MLSHSAKFGPIGSTEWGEDFTEWISDHVVAYINMGRSLVESCNLCSQCLRYSGQRIPSQDACFSSFSTPSETDPD